MNLLPTTRMSYLLALPMAAAYAAAIPGIPEAPRPGNLPETWITWSNDAFGGEIGKNSDDFRTNAMSLYHRFGDKWIASLDHSTLTVKATNTTAGHRSDELSTGATYVLYERHDAPIASFFGTSAGIRLSGKHGGAFIQNNWHELGGINTVDLDYEDGTNSAWLGLHGSWIFTKTLPFHLHVAPFAPSGRWGLGLDVSNLLTTNGTFEGALGLRGMLMGKDGGMWLGLREEIRAGQHDTRTTEAVAEHEDGTWISYGASVGSFFFQGGYNLKNEAAMGSVGGLWNRPLNPSGQNNATLMGEIGATINSYGIGVQFRWRPQWTHKLGRFADFATVLVDYRFGSVPGVEWADNTLRSQQALVGLDLAFLPLQDGWQFQPFSYLGLGYRYENTHIEGPNPQFAQQHEVGAAVVQGGLGLRTFWGDLPKDGTGIRYGLSTTFDIWQPFHEDTFTEGALSEDVLQAHNSISVRLIAHVGW